MPLLLSRVGFVPIHIVDLKAHALRQRNDLVVMKAKIFPHSRHGNVSILRGMGPIHQLLQVRDDSVAPHGVIINYAP